MIGPAIEELNIRATGQRTGPPGMIKRVGDQRHRICFCASNKLTQKMQRFTSAGHRNDLRVIRQFAGIRPAPVNIMLNRSYKPLIASCFWVKLPAGIMFGNTVQQKLAWRHLRLANRHIKHRYRRVRWNRVKDCAQLHKHITVKNSMRWIEFHKLFVTPKSRYRKTAFNMQKNDPRRCCVIGSA